MSEKRTDEIPIGLIVYDDFESRARETNDLDHIRRLKRAGPEKWPNLIVTQRADGLFALLDGHHRLQAGLALGLDEFTCDIIGLEEDSEYLTAVSLNLDGRALPLKRGDRKVFAEWLHKRYPDLSARRIALAVGLSDKTIGKIIDKDGAGSAQGKTRSGINSVLSLMKRVITTGEGAGFLGLGNRAQTVADRIIEGKDPKAVLKSVKTWIPVLERAIELVEEEWARE